MNEKGSDQLLKEAGATQDTIMKTKKQDDERLAKEQERVEQTPPAEDEPGHEYPEREPPT